MLQKLKAFIFGVATASVCGGVSLYFVFQTYVAHMLGAATEHSTAVLLIISGIIGIMSVLFWVRIEHFFSYTFEITSFIPIDKAAGIAYEKLRAYKAAEVAERTGNITRYFAESLAGCGKLYARKPPFKTLVVVNRRKMGLWKADCKSATVIDPEGAITYQDFMIKKCHLRKYINKVKARDVHRQTPKP